LGAGLLVLRHQMERGFAIRPLQHGKVLVDRGEQHARGPIGGPAATGGGAGGEGASQVLHGPKRMHEPSYHAKLPVSPLALNLWGRRRYDD
jgi:hypothetical protein